MTQIQGNVVGGVSTAGVSGSGQGDAAGLAATTNGLEASYGSTSTTQTQNQQDVNQQVNLKSIEDWQGMLVNMNGDVQLQSIVADEARQTTARELGYSSYSQLKDAVLSSPTRTVTTPSGKVVSEQDVITKNQTNVKESLYNRLMDGIHDSGKYGEYDLVAAEVYFGAAMGISVEASDSSQNNVDVTTFIKAELGLAIAKNLGVNGGTLDQIVQTYIQNRSYIADNGEVWRSADETAASRGGDCEDLVNEMASILASQNLPGVASVRVGIRDMADGQGHAVILLQDMAGNFRELDISGMVENKLTFNGINSLQSVNLSDYSVSYTATEVTADQAYTFDGKQYSTASATTPTNIASMEAYTTYMASWRASNKPTVPVSATSLDTINAGIAANLNYRFNELQEMADVMSKNPDTFKSPGSLYVIQIAIQQIKDIISAVTAVGKSVNDTISEVLQSFTSKVSQI